MAFYSVLDPRFRMGVKKDDLPAVQGTSQTDIDDLVLPVAANKDYTMLAILELEQVDADADFRIGFSGPAGAIMEWDSVATSVGVKDINETDIFDVGASPALGIVMLKGILHVAATAGVLQLNMAQNVSKAFDNNVNSGSRLILITE